MSTQATQLQNIPVFKSNYPQDQREWDDFIRWLYKLLTTTREIQSTQSQQFQSGVAPSGQGLTQDTLLGEILAAKPGSPSQSRSDALPAGRSPILPVGNEGILGLVKQQPVPRTAWVSFTPTVTPGGAMTLTSITTNVGRHFVIGKTCMVVYNLVGVLGGALDPVIQFSHPFVPLTGVVFWSYSAAVVQDQLGSPIIRPLYAKVTNLGAFIHADDGANLAAGQIEVELSGVYELA